MDLYEARQITLTPDEQRSYEFFRHTLHMDEIAARVAARGRRGAFDEAPGVTEQLQERRRQSRERPLTVAGDPRSGCEQPTPEELHKQLKESFVRVGLSPEAAEIAAAADPSASVRDSLIFRSAKAHLREAEKPHPHGGEVCDGRVLGERSEL